MYTRPKREPQTATFHRRAPISPLSDETARTATIERIADPASLNLDSLWDTEWERNLMAAALERMKARVSGRQFQMFDLYVLQHWPVGDVARTLRVSVAQVYLAKHRVSALLKKAVKKLEKEMK